MLFYFVDGEISRELVPEQRGIPAHAKSCTALDVSRTRECTWMHSAIIFVWGISYGLKMRKSAKMSFCMGWNIFSNGFKRVFHMGCSYGLKMQKSAKMYFLGGLKSRKISIFEWVQKNYYMGSKLFIIWVKNFAFGYKMVLFWFLYGFKIEKKLRRWCVIMTVGQFFRC